MRRTSRPGARHLAAALLCLVALALPLPASADDGSLFVDVPGDGVGFTRDAGVALLDVGDLYPGGMVVAGVGVRNASPYDASLVLDLVDVASRENSCVRPEQREVGEGCDADGGELDDWLEATVRRGGALLWHGPFSELARGADLGALPAGAEWALEVTLELPYAAGNETMTDTVAFGTRLVATSSAGVSTVAGPQVSAGTGGHAQADAGRGASALPLTGASLGLAPIVLGVVLVSVGAALAASGRLTRRSRSR